MPIRPLTTWLCAVCVALLVVQLPTTEAQDDATDEDRPPPSPRDARGERDRHRDDDGDRDLRRGEQRRGGRRGSFERPDRMMGRAGDDGPHLSDEQIRQRLEILKHLHPEITARIEQRMSDSEDGDIPPQLRKRLQQHMRRMGPKIERLIQLRQNDPEAFELFVEDRRHDRLCHKLTARLRAASDDTDTEQKLKDAISRHFEVRQRQYEHDLTKLEKRVQRLREKIEWRRSNPKKVQKQRLADLTGHSSEGW
jgi:hypothetical protein